MIKFTSYTQMFIEWSVLFLCVCFFYVYIFVFLCVVIIVFCYWPLLYEASNLINGRFIIIHSFSILSDDRSKASSKTIPPHSAI